MLVIGYFDELKRPPIHVSSNHLTVVGTPSGEVSSYAAAALRGEAHEVATALEGTRNHTLNKAWFNMGRHIGAGTIDVDTVRLTLTEAARQAGLPVHEIEGVLRDDTTSGLNAGAAMPRVPAPLPELPGATVLHDGLPERVNGTSAPAESATEAPDEPEVASWAPVSLDDVLDGTYEPELPSLMPRTDDQHLLYPGRIHSFHGESESGKSLIAQAEAARLMSKEGGNDGCRDVLFIDFESDRSAVVGRLLELGVTRDEVRRHFTYIRPEVDPRRFPHEREAVSALLAKPYALAVVDGVTEALGIFGASTKDNDDITSWMRVLPRTVARLTGAAVILVDHVTKDSEGRGRFAIGGQAKMAALDGAAYVVEVTEALGRGKRGMVTLRVAKDRPGGVRAHAGPFRAGDRTQEAARVVVDSSLGDQLIHVTVREPKVTETVDGAPAFRPTRIMERISRHLEDADEPLSKAVIEGLAGANRDTVRTALAFLVKEHFAKEEKGARGAILHLSVMPYREAADRLSDAYVPAPTTLTSPTSPNLARPRPGRGGSDLAQHPAPPTGLGEVGRARSKGSPRPTSGEVTGEVETTTTAGTTASTDTELVACTKCFTPIETRLARVNGGRCNKCRERN